MPNAHLSLKVYRLLLKFYPASFRDEYVGPMEREFCDELAASNNSLAGFWLRLLADLAVSIPLQFSRQLFQDARYTVRLWARSPGRIGFMILALAVGIGANTGVFSVVNALLLRSLPFQDPSRLASLGTFFPPHASAKEFHQWRQGQASYLADAALVEQGDVNVGTAQIPARVHASRTSWNFFTILGAQPALGRWFVDGEDTHGKNLVVVVSYGLWQQFFAGDQRAIGSTLRVNGVAFTIVGVAPVGFSFPSNTDVWEAAEYSPGNNGWQTIARLKPGVTWPQARAGFAVEAARLWPQRDELGNSEHDPKMTSLQDEVAGPARNASLLLMAGVALILLIACTNVANLVLAHTADRARELSIRYALGASRSRIAQQLLTECLLLSLVATAAGLLVAFWTASIAARVQPVPLSTQVYSILDGRVLGFAIAVGICSSLLFGILPSFNAGCGQMIGSPASTSPRGRRAIREALVAVQVTITIILITASVSVGRAFVRLLKTDHGFHTTGLVTVSVSLDGTARGVNGHQLPYFEDALDRIRRLPGVRSASETEFLPLDATGFVGGPFGFDGHPARQNSTMIPVMSDYFQTMGGRVLYGREFSGAEVRSDAKVVVVNRRFAAEFGPPADALGHQVTIDNDPPRKIIGVVEAMDYMTDTMDTAHSNQIFIPAHSPGGFVSTFVARVDDRAEDALPVIRDTIRSVDTQVPVFGVKTMDQRLAGNLLRPKSCRTALFFFAGFASLLAVIGIYGVVSYAVAQRTREMGVRLALGATPLRLRASLLRQGLLSVAAGAIVGIIGSALAGRFLESLVAGATSSDFATLALSILFIALIASSSIWTATRRIAHFDIWEILRVE